MLGHCVSCKGELLFPGCDIACVQSFFELQSAYMLGLLLAIVDELPVLPCCVGLDSTWKICARLD